MSSPTMILSLTLIILFSTSPHAAGDGHNTTTTNNNKNKNNLSAYEVLEQYNFPIGLLPQGVTGYELNNETGEFAVFLNETCSFNLETYKLKYKPTITGVISKDRIKNLKGISVKVLLFWFNIVEVSRDGDDLLFSVGLLSASFPIRNFLECPQCGCGLDCNDLDKGAESSSLMSS
ncbi:hypothetical protein TIFTF001_007253 [Ficus carica]|uniref:DUF538 domain-containing protein n=1 Tax=Ficus carica TaxID=3494 RepID=A0AA88A2I8_FICCA|nr:hypothetical protein TIFTF001_007253 [Ficus carica]